MRLKQLIRSKNNFVKEEVRSEVEENNNNHTNIQIITRSTRSSVKKEKDNNQDQVSNSSSSSNISEIDSYFSNQGNQQLSSTSINEGSSMTPTPEKNDTEGKGKILKENEEISKIEIAENVEKN